MERETNHVVPPAPRLDLRLSIAPIWRFAFFVVFAVLVGASPARAQTSNSNMSGRWNGQYVMTDHCDDGSTYSYSGIATAAFNQAGTSVTGDITFQDVVGTDGKDCRTRRSAGTVTLGVSGSVTGSSFAGTLFTDTTHPVSLSGSVASTSMTLSFPANPTTSGTITLTLAGTPAQVDLTGIWSGTATETVMWSSVSGSCANGTPAPIVSSGPSTLAIAQLGSTFAGSITLPHSWRDPSNNGVCALVDSGPTSFAFSGIVSGSAIINSSLPLSVSGSIITFTFPESASALDHGSFTLTKQTSLPAQPDLTGIWSGTMNMAAVWGSGSPSCGSGTPAPITASGLSTLAIAQTGSTFAGSLTWPHVWCDHKDSDSGVCTWVDRGMVAVTVSGTVSGSTITASITQSGFACGPGDGTEPLILSVSGSTVTGNFGGNGAGGIESGSFTLTRQVIKRRATAKH
jgi:hypothetical protein